MCNAHAHAQDISKHKLVLDTTFVRPRKIHTQLFITCCLKGETTWYCKISACLNRLWPLGKT